MDLVRQIDSNIIIIGDFNNLLSTMDRSLRQNQYRTTGLNYIVDEKNLSNL